MTKKPILIISPHIPAYDTNAGDWRVWRLVRELSKKYNIYFCIINAKTNLKYKRALKKYVKKILPLPSAKNFEKLLNFENIKTVIFEKYFGADYSKLFAHFAVAEKFVVDTHDIDWVKAKRAGIESRSVKNNETRLYKIAKNLIAISAADKKFLPRGKPAIIIPTPAEAAAAPHIPFEKRRGVALWAYWKYPANADSLKYFKAEIAPKLPKEIKVDVLGCGAKKVKNIQKELSKYRIVAVPLRWGSGIKKKIIDAFSAQTPVITTHAGAEGINIDKALVCANAEKFAQVLLTVYNDKKLWDKFSKSGYKLFVKNYTVESFQKSLKQLYKIIV